MLHLLSRLWTRRRADSRTRGRRTRPVENLTVLEERQLLYFSVTAVAHPQILFPPNGRTVPVELSGTFLDFDNDHPRRGTFIPEAKFLVVDEVRKLDFSGPITDVVSDGNNLYSYNVTINLPATGSKSLPGGRHFSVTAAAHDNGGWSGKTISVWVPHDKAQLRPHRIPHPHPITTPPPAKHANPPASSPSNPSKNPLQSLFGSL